MTFDNDCMAQPEGPRCGYHLLYLDAVARLAAVELALKGTVNQHHRKGIQHSDGMHYRHTNPPEECDELFCYEARHALAESEEGPSICHDCGGHDTTDSETPCVCSPPLPAVEEPHD